MRRAPRPLSTQTRIAMRLDADGAQTIERLRELLHDNNMPPPTKAMVAQNLHALRTRGQVFKEFRDGVAWFALTDLGKRDLDIQLLAQHRLAERTARRGTTRNVTLALTAAAPISTAAVSAKIDQIARAAIALPPQFDPPITNTVPFSRAHLRILARRALDSTAPLDDAARAAIADAIKEAA